MSDHQGEKLKDFLATWKDANGKRKSIEEISTDLGVSRSTMYYQFNKRKLDLDFVELLRAKGYKFDPNEVEQMISNVSPAYLPEKKGNIIFVPLYAYGGFLHGYSDKVFIDKLERFSLPRIHGEHFAFEVRGESMAPYAKPGDTVIARKEEQLEWMVKGDPYILQTVDGLILKIFDKLVENKAYFKSADKDHNHPVIPMKDIKGVYRVVKVVKDFMTA